MLWLKAGKLSEAEFKRKFGYYRQVFFDMVKVINDFKTKARLADKRGNKSDFSSEDEVLIMLWYYREYVTYFSIATELEVVESTIARIVTKTENILIKSRVFSLPGKKKIRDSNGQYKTIIIDATEQRIEKPKDSKKQKDSYSGKKKLIPKKHKLS
jgi:hypothetical protein